MFRKDATGWSLDLSLKVRYIALYFGVVIAFVCVLAYAYSRASADMRATITYGSSLLGATVAICALLYNAENLRIANRGKAKEAASRFIERWNNPGYIPIRTEWRQLTMANEGKKDELTALLEADVKARSLVVEILNFFEEIALSINLGTADEVILERFFGYLLSRTFYDYKPWIEKHRELRNAPDYWKELELIAKRWKV